jgi:hypothetical protein
MEFAMHFFEIGQIGYIETVFRIIDRCLKLRKPRFFTLQLKYMSRFADSYFLAPQDSLQQRHN